MTRQNLWILIAGLILLAIAGIAFRSVQYTNTTFNGTPPVATGTPATTPSVTLHDKYRRGVHTITGALLAPNPCTIATATSTLVGNASTSQNILVTVSMPTDTGTCLQEPATTTFSTTLTAPAKLPIQTVVNGITATTTS